MMMIIRYKNINQIDMHNISIMHAYTHNYISLICLICLQVKSIRYDFMTN